MGIKYFRLIYIFWTLLRFGWYEFAFSLPMLSYFRWLTPILSRCFKVDKYSTGEKLRLALEALGPTFIKLGQALSTRRDLIPDEIINELCKLQDQVPSFDSNIAISIIETAYRKPINEIFKDFEYEPIAAASIAQVHGATLFDGKKVVVKIVRPNIEKVIRRDIELMKILANLGQKYYSDAKRMHLPELVSEYEKTISNELNLTLEAANAVHFKRNFADSKSLYVPDIYEEYTKKNILVMERISGISIGQTAQLKALNIDMEHLAEISVDVFFTQVFKHSFFHADMHPGNIFIDASDPQNPKYIALDFGIIGTLSTDDQRYLADNFLAFFNRDYRRVAELHVESGWVPQNTSVDEFELAIMALCEPIFNKPLRDISFGGFLLSLFITARRFQMEIQPQLLLLQKTLLAIEGLGRELYPDLDLWKTAKPFLIKFVKEKRGPKAIIKRYQRDMPMWAEQLPDFMKNTNLLVRKGLQGQMNVVISPRDMQEIKRSIRDGQRRQTLSILSLILLGFILYHLPDTLNFKSICYLIVAGALLLFSLRK